MTPEAEHAIEMRRLAEDYRAFGFNVVPLGGDKRPVITGVNPSGGVNHFRWRDWEATKQADKLWKDIRKQAYWADVYGVGAICGPVSGNLICVDFDKADPALVDEFLTLAGLPKTWTVQTPGGGFHVWLTCPDWTQDKNRLDRPSLDGAGHIEIRYTGHYAALPGSHHPSGGLYTWATGNAPTAAPTALGQAALLEAYGAVTVEAPAPTPAPSTPSTNGNGAGKWGQKALDDEVAKLRLTAPGGRNAAVNRSAFSLSQIVAGGALDESTVRQALTDAAIAIGLSEGEAAGAIGSGFRAGVKQPRFPTPSTNGNGTSKVYEYGFTDEQPDALDLEPANVGTPAPDADSEADDDDAEATPETARKHQTWPYRISKGKMWFLFERKGEIDMAPIADFIVAITEEIIDEQGNTTLVLEGAGLRAGAFRTEIAGADFGSDSKILAAITAATGGIDPVYADMTKHLRVAIGKLTKTTKRSRRTRYHRTGWTDETCTQFLLPGADPGTLLDLPREIAYSAPLPTADPFAGLLALRALLDAFEGKLTSPLIGALLMPPLLQVAGLGNERFAAFIAGRTGSLKTSWTQTAMCIYGHGFANNDALLKLGEGSTSNALMGYATHAHDLPLFIDNYKPNTGGGAGYFVGFIHNVLEGSDRKRANRDGGLRESRQIRCIPVVTGEDFPRDDAASVARVLLVNFAWNRGEPNDALTEAQRKAKHLPTVGKSWIDWLAGAGREVAQTVADTFPDRRARWAKDIQKFQPDTANIARIASNLAVLEVTWETALQHPTIGKVLALFTADFKIGLNEVSRTMANSSTLAMEALQYRNALRELLGASQYRLLDRMVTTEGSGFDRDRILGWRDPDGIYLLPAITLAAVRRLLGPQALTGSSQTLYNQMEQLGWIVSRDKNQTTKSAKMGGTQARVLHLHPSVLDGSDDAGADEYEQMGAAEIDALGF
jgi:hypothetical protein